MCRTPAFIFFARGFTLVELMIGMVITGLALAAIASVMTAVSTGWTQQGDTQSTYLANRQTIVRVQTLLRSAKLIGLVRQGSLASNTTSQADVFYWRSDVSSGAQDRQIQFSELGLLEHDRIKDCLRFYFVQFPSNWTTAQQQSADTVYKYSDLTNPSAPENFKALNYVVSRVIANNVTGAAFYAENTTGQNNQLPTFEFQLAIVHNGVTSQVCGTTALRSPDYKPCK